MHDYIDITLTNEFIKDTRPCILLQLSIDLNTENINIILGKISASSMQLWNILMDYATSLHSYTILDCIKRFKRSVGNTKIIIANESLNLH